MKKTLRQTYTAWAENSTGLGIVSRQILRAVRTQAYKKQRVNNIAMFHAGRCGSSVLNDLLDQRADFHWRHEPFENMLPAYYRMASKNRAYHVIGNSMYKVNVPHFGCDIKYLPEQHLRPELANKSPVEFVELLDNLGFNRFILLDRKNYLRQAVSTVIGGITGVWTSNDPAPKKTTAHIDPKRFVSYQKEMPLLDFFHSLSDTHSKFRSILQGRNILELNYETDILKDPLISYRKTCEFLEIEPIIVSVRLSKINPYPISGLIENFDEIVETLSGTEYEWMLHD